MAKLLLDETFFERDNTDNYIDEIIKFIDKYFKDDIVFFILIAILVIYGC